MLLRTPKRYKKNGRRRYLLNLRWLWLYLIAPVIIIPAAAIWQFRAPISSQVGKWVDNNVRIELNPPTVTPTVPATDLQRQFAAFVQAGEFQNAIDTLDSLNDTMANDVNLFTLRTQMILFRGDPTDQKRLDEALKSAYGAINANPEVSDGWVTVAMVLTEAGRYKDALPYLLRARDFDDNNPMLLAVMGAAYLGLERIDRAEEIIDQAIEEAKTAKEINIMALAYAYLIKGNIVSLRQGREAIKFWEESWRIGKTDPMMPLGFIAQALWSYYINASAGESQKIIAILTEASTRDKDDAVNPYLLGRIYLKFGDPDKATSFYQRCLDIDPNQTKCLSNLSRQMILAQNFTRAAELAQRAIDLGSTEAAAYLRAGWAYAQMQACAKAIPLLQKGLTLNPSEVELAQMREALSICGASSVVPVPTATETPAP